MVELLQLHQLFYKIYGIIEQNPRLAAEFTKKLESKGFQELQFTEGRRYIVRANNSAGRGIANNPIGLLHLHFDIVEIVGQNRSASGVLDNAARVAGKIALTLHGSTCCKDSDGAKLTGGSWQVQGIDPSQALGTDGAPLPQGRAYSVRLSATNFTLTDFQRLTHAPKAGAP